MKLSIVIPSRCRGDLLALCLQSLGRHAPAGTEIVVVDDASAGGAISAVAGRFPGVRVLRLPRPRGFCGAVNAGLRQAAGEVVELLNDDTEVTPGWADAALPWFRESGIGAVAPQVLCGPAGELIDSAGDRYFLGGIAGKHHHGVRAHSTAALPRFVFGASASSAFYRRETLLRVGAFPEHFKAYFDDVDVAFRLQRAGFKTIYEPRARVLHRVSASYGSPGRQLLEQMSCNEERVFWRNMPLRAWPRAVPWHLAVLAGKAARRWREGCLTPFLCGRLRVLTETMAVWKHRRHLQARWPEADPEQWGVERGYWDEDNKKGRVC
jgi:GT2 family glycosyltransferase